MDEGFLVTPEPSEAERTVVLAALTAARADERRGLDPWTAAALREATEKEAES
jgi:hypothetical protein